MLRQECIKNKTRSHSSTMHTACLLTISPSMHCAGECLVWGVSAPGGCLVQGGAWSGGCLVQGGAWSGGCLVQGVSAPGSAWWGDACSWGGGGGIPARNEADPPCEQNSCHTLLKILPCPELRLRAVINGLKGRKGFTRMTKLTVSWIHIKHHVMFKNASR